MQNFLYRIAIWAILASGANTLHAQGTVTGVGVKTKKVDKTDKPGSGEKDDINMLSKEVTIETTCAANATVFIENSYRNIHIKTATDNKVRLITTAFYSDETKLTDAEWFEKLNIELKGSGSMIVVKSGTVNLNSSNDIFTTVTGTINVQSTKKVAKVRGYGISNSGSNTLAVLDGLGNFQAVQTDVKRDITIYIPNGARVDVESKYADVDIANNIGEIKARITNASLTMENATKAIIISQYGNVNAGNLDDAQLEMTNGRLRAKDIAKLDLDTKYSTVDLGMCGDVAIRSVNDQYEFDQVKELHGRKDYGNFRITSLLKSFELEGSNADIKIRSIEPSVTAVKIDNKYADLRLPVSSLKNFAVNFDGQYSSVYAPFEKIADTSKNAQSSAAEVVDYEEVPARQAPAVVKGAKPKKITGTATGIFSSNDTFAPFAATLYGSGGNFGDGKDSKFTASVGDTKGSYTNFQLKCVNCTVDFK